MSIMYKNPTFIICPGPFEFSQWTWSQSYEALLWNIIAIMQVLFFNWLSVGAGYTLHTLKLQARHTL